MHFAVVIAMALLFAIPVMAADINTSSWSETDNNNNQAPPAGWPENMNPAQVNDTARANMGAIKRWYDRINPTATTAGTANAQTLTYSVAPTALTAGDRYSFIVGAGLSASAATLNINGLGAKTVVGNLVAGQVVEVYYDGTKFIVFCCSSSSINGVTPQQYGAKGDGVTNDSVAFQAAVTAAAAIKLPLHLLGGSTYAVDDIALPHAPLSIIGDGAMSSKILRVANSAATTGVLHCFSAPTTGCNGLWVSGITIDGNKTNQVNAASPALNIGEYHDVHIRDVYVINTLGVGVGLDFSEDQLFSSTSDMINVKIFGSSSDGLIVTTKSWGLLLQNVVAMNNGGNGANIYYTPGITPINDAFLYTTVLGGDYSSNGAAGFVARGWIVNYVGGDPAQPIYGAGPLPVNHIILDGVTAKDNFRYGIVVQARNSIVSNSSAVNNNLAGDYGGGFLGPCGECEWNNLYAAQNNIGIDVGTAQGAHIRGGNFESNSTGVNIGSTSFSDIRGATVTSNTTGQIHASSPEAAGDGYGIAGFTDSLVIEGNRVGCNLAGQFGIKVYKGGRYVSITDNYVQGCDDDKAIVAEVASARVDGNKVARSSNPFDGIADYTVNAANPTLVFPVWGNYIALTGANNFSNIKTMEQNTDGDGVYAVLITNAGTGYTNGSATATFSGCAVPPTGTVLVNRGGGITGYSVATVGSGCVSPTVSFGGGGSGAAGTVFSVPLSAGFQKELTLLVGAGASLTMGGGGNIVLGSAAAGLAATTTFKFLFGGLGSATTAAYELSRVAH